MTLGPPTLEPQPLTPQPLQVIGAPIAAGLLRLDGAGGLSGWRWLFLVEGLPTLLLGLALFRLLPPRPTAAPFLSPAEGRAVEAAVEACRGSAAHAAAHSDGALIWAALRNPALWHVSGVKFAKDVTSYGCMFWCGVKGWGQGQEGEGSVWAMSRVLGLCNMRGTRCWARLAAALPSAGYRALNGGAQTSGKHVDKASGLPPSQERHERASDTPASPLPQP